MIKRSLIHQVILLLLSLFWIKGIIDDIRISFITSRGSLYLPPTLDAMTINSLRFYAENLLYVAFNLTVFLWITKSSQPKSNMKIKILVALLATYFIYSIFASLYAIANLGVAFDTSPLQSMMNSDFLLLLMAGILQVYVFSMFLFNEKILKSKEKRT